ncbi:MAG: histidine triad nucleotide-binding protein [Clostridiales bacterium]|nr:histidine triad nucleotide-binding protein [Clostridiales bacterium]
MERECIFCKIADKEIPADIVYEDEEIVCFRDLAPQAPVHVLIIPREHIASLDDIADSAAHVGLLGHMMAKVKEVAAGLGLSNGYRLVSNCGKDGLQTVGHLHFHLIGGRGMGWPPG